MNLRTALILAGLATLAGGCTVAPYGEPVYGPGYPVYSDADSYGGYFYFQIIYIDGAPWYVDDYRHAHPIPPHLRSHFRDSSWARSLPPRFGDDDDVRDGYRLSRIVYVNDVPLYVGDDRQARPVPSRVRGRFPYQEVVTPRDARRNGGERPPVPQPRYDNGARPMAPAYGREPERQAPPGYGRDPERQAPPVYGREPERQAPPAYGREPDRQAPPAYGREREMPPSYGRERERMGPPSYGPQTAPQPAMAPERVREAPQGRPQPAAREGRGEPQGRSMEQPSDRGAGMGRPAPQDGGRNANDAQRGGTESRQNGKAPGRGKGRDGGDGQEDGRNNRDDR